MMGSYWRTAVKLAWAELRSSPRRVLIVVAAVAIGAAATTAVRALSDEMRSKLQGNAREWIASDIQVRLHEPTSDDENAALGTLLKSGVEQTTITETYGMAKSEQVPDAALVYLKVVDATRYPFYGTMELRPPQSLPQALSGNSVVVSRDLLDRLQLGAGDHLRLGAAEFRVSSAIAAEPDWNVGLSTALPRIILSPENFERSGIARLNNNQSSRLLFRLAGANLSTVRAQVERIFPYGAVMDYRDPDPPTAATFDEAGSYLTMAAGLVWAAGAIALALLMYLHVQQRLDSIAVMKVLGAGSNRILAIYALQASGIALAGGLLGALAGPLFARALAELAQLYLPLGLKGHWEWFRAVQSTALGLCAALPAVLGPILSIRRARPMSILRRHAASVSRVPRILSTPLFFPLALRLATRSLFLPGRQSVAIVLALTAGVAMLSATYVAERRVGESIARVIPADGANLYLIGLDRGSLDDAIRWLAHQPDVEGRPKVFSMTWLRLAAINGAAVTSDSRGIHGLWLATCSEAAPAGSVLLPRAGVGPEVLAGDVLEFTAAGHTLRGRASVQRVNYLDGIVSGGITFPCSEFKGLTIFYHVAVRVRPSEEFAVRRALGARFPSLPNVSRMEFTGLVRTVADQALRMVRSLCWMALAIGVALQALLVGAAQRLRRGETAIARALGARPGFLTRVSFCEFGLLGLLAGIAGGLLGAGFASITLSAIFHRATFVFDPPTMLCAAAFTSLLAAAAGSIVVAGSQRSTPLEILRDE
jgi:predicted lysophospholipase L1 biosynthesis ABC-type transport system permease subunit